MIDAIIRGSLGDFGSALLDFYITNRIWINAALLFYAGFLALAKFGHTQIIKAIKSYFIKTYGEEALNKNLNWLRKTMEQSQPDWQNISKETWIPLLSEKKSFWFYLKSKENLESRFTPEKIIRILQP